MDGELGEHLIPGVGLDVDADDLGGAGELGGFGSDEAGGEVAGEDRELFHLVGEGAIDKDGAEVGALAGGGPDVGGAAGVGGEDHGGVGGFDDKADGGHFVVDGDGGELDSVHFESYAGDDRNEFQRHVARAEHFDSGEVGPDDA